MATNKKTKSWENRTTVNYDTDDINCGKNGESFVFKGSKSKSFKELIKSLTPACDSNESDHDFNKAFQPLIVNSNMFFVTLGEPTESRLPKRFLIMDILMFGISFICK